MNEQKIKDLELEVQSLNENLKRQESELWRLRLFLFINCVIDAGICFF